ncbi:hypothetical protein [Bacillus thuringiensis]|uniref:hypothetical protein n=1 Tax=Bacillus thuringiensis TaxID=1428 RepID=UPI00217E9F15|nr:hypothetical protein [Bacillus thuringiensis]
MGTFISILGEQIVNECINPDKLEWTSIIHNELYDNTTPKERGEAMISLLDKTMDEFMDSKG